MARDPFSLEGKVAFVTGANSGLGLTVALSLCDAGAQVAVGARRASRNAEALASLGPSATAFTVDVTDEASSCARNMRRGTCRPKASARS